MPDYSYSARDRAGRTVQGTVTADNAALAHGKIRSLGYEVDRVRAVEVARTQEILPPAPSLRHRFAEAFIYPVVSGVPLKALAVFYRQFATMINAGIPLYQSLATLEGQTANARLRGILRDAQVQVLSGGKLSDVLAKHRYAIGDLQIEMIRAAEHGGMLDQMLLRIADYLEQELELRRLIGRLTLYPKLVSLMALFILGRGFFADLTPAVSKLVIGMMGKNAYTGLDYLRDTVLFLAEIGLVAFLVIAFFRVVLFQSPGARVAYERAKMAIPGIGTVARQFALARFGRAFGAMYAGGLPLGVAIRVAGDASGSRLIAGATARAVLASERGTTLSQAFRETGVFPALVLDMLHTGEQTGNLDAMMGKAAEYLEGEASTRAHQYAHIFAVVIYLVVAIFVAYAVISGYGGYASGVGAALGG